MNSIFKAKQVETQWNQSQLFLEIIYSVYNLSPTPFPWEKRVSEKSVFLDIFQKLSSNHKIKSNPIHKIFQ